MVTFLHNSFHLIPRASKRKALKKQVLKQRRGFTELEGGRWNGAGKSGFFQGGSLLKDSLVLLTWMFSLWLALPNWEDTSGYWEKIKMEGLQIPSVV